MNYQGIRERFGEIANFVHHEVGMPLIVPDDGECITDAVLETRRILRAAAVLRGEAEPERQPRFGFEFPGAVQGFQVDREPRHLTVRALVECGAGRQPSWRFFVRHRTRSRGPKRAGRDS